MGGGSCGARFRSKRGRREPAEVADLPRRCEKHRWGRALQWNLGGQELKLLDVTALESDVIFVQEVARRDEGWLCEDSEHFHWVQFRGPALWRGVGVGIAIDKFDCVVNKVAVRRGIWVLARLRGFGRVVLGSLHALTGVTNARYQETVLEFMRSCPSSWRQYPMVCGFDVNEVPCWNPDPAEAEDLGRVPLDHCSSNLNVLAGQALSMGLVPSCLCHINSGSQPISREMRRELEGKLT